jgi:hypothetical protein
MRQERHCVVPAAILKSLPRNPVVKVEGEGGRGTMIQESVTSGRSDDQAWMKNGDPFPGRRS